MSDNLSRYEVRMQQVEITGNKKEPKGSLVGGVLLSG